MNPPPSCGEPPWSASEPDPLEARMAEVLALAPELRQAAFEELCAREPELAVGLRARWRALAAMGLDPSPGRAAGGGIPEILGDFRLLERLGAGGMGVVYRARQESLGRDVALKLMRPEGVFFPRSRERFRREIEAVAQLKHPGIVPVHSVGEEQGLPYFAMELLEGATLAEVLSRLTGRALSGLSGADLADAVAAKPDARGQGVFALGWTEACTELVRQVAEALQHAHEKGILHRDVKPSNVALTRDGRAQLFDFGLATTRAVERLTQTGGQLGTLHYMSPEQLRGERELDARSDVYSLGVTLYELLTLEAPFRGESRNQIESEILSGRPETLRARNRRVAPELELVCAKAMELDPARRYATAREFAADLRCVLEHRPVRARAAGPGLRLRRWAQRNPAIAVGILSASVLFGVAPSVLLWRERSYSSELAAALDKESLALAAERAALEETRSAQYFLEDLFVSASPYASGNPDARVRDVLERGVQSLERLEGSPRLEGRLALALSVAFSANALFEEALPLAQRAYAIEQETGERLDARLDRPVEALAICLSALDREAEAEVLLRAELARENDPETGARLHFALARAVRGQERYGEALELYRKTREFYLDGRPESREPLMAVDYRIAFLEHQLGRPEEALALAQEGLDLGRELFPEDHPARAEGLSRQALPLLALGRPDEALEAQASAMDSVEAFYGYGSYAAARYREDMATLLAQLGDWSEAARVAAEVVAINTSLFGPEHPRTVNVRRLAEAYAQRAGR